MYTVHISSETVGSLPTFSFFLLFVVGSAVGVTYLVSRWGLDAPTQLPAAAMSRLMPHLFSSPAALRRRVTAALAKQVLITPAGDRVAYPWLVVRIAPEDFGRLAPNGNAQWLVEELLKVYASIAVRSGLRVTSSITITLQIDPALRPGWIPPARPVPANSAVTGVSQTVSIVEFEQLGQASSRISAGLPLADAGSEPLSPQPEEDGSDGEDFGTDLSWNGVADRGAPPPAERAGERGNVRGHAQRDDAVRYTVLAGTGTEKNSGGVGAAAVPVIVLEDPTGARVRATTGVTMGRDPESTICLPGVTVSWKHARIFVLEQQWQVEDQGSLNGTLLNGVVLAKHVARPLHVGSVIRLGHAGPQVRVVRADISGTLTATAATA